MINAVDEVKKHVNKYFIERTKLLNFLLKLAFSYDFPDITANNFYFCRTN